MYDEAWSSGHMYAHQWIHCTHLNNTKPAIDAFRLQFLIIGLKESVMLQAANDHVRFIHSFRSARSSRNLYVCDTRFSVYSQQAIGHLNETVVLCPCLFNTGISVTQDT